MIKNLVLLTFILLTFVFTTKALARGSGGGRPWEQKLFVGAYYGAGIVNMHGQESIPTYNGSSYGADMEYRIGGEVSLAIYANYTLGNYKNSKNDSAQTENLEFRSYHGGLKLYIYDFYIKGGYGHIQGSDESNGEVIKTIEFSNESVNAGLGMSFPISRLVSINIETEMVYSSFEPSYGGFSKKTKLINYTGVIGLKFLLPSEAYVAPSR